MNHKLRINLLRLALALLVVGFALAFKAQSPAAYFVSLFGILMTVAFLVEAHQDRERAIANCMARHPAGGRR